MAEPVPCEDNCSPGCDVIFDRVVVSYLMRGGTRVMWELEDAFSDPSPYEFQLQVGQSKNINADDWVDVGLPVTNQFFAVDGEQRLHNKMKFQFYRVQLMTPVGTYFSQPTGLSGTLSRRDWRLAREIMRQETQRMRLHAGQKGVLLKRRITGENCPTCLDHQTNEIRDPHCPDCWGTGKKCGYFFPIDCIWADIDPRTYHIELDAGAARGTINDVAVRARMCNTWMLSEEDIFVDIKTDDRYYVHKVQNRAEYRGVPLIADVELRPAPVTDVAYDIDIPQMEALNV